MTILTQHTEGLWTYSIPDLDIEGPNCPPALFEYRGHIIGVVLFGDFDIEWHQCFKIICDGEEVEYMEYATDDDEAELACDVLAECALYNECDSDEFKLALSVVLDAHLESLWVQ